MKLIERFGLLAAKPYLAPAVDDVRKGYRRSVCGADSIYYRIEGNTIDIMAILGRQDTQNRLFDT